MAKNSQNASHNRKIKAPNYNAQKTFRQITHALAQTAKIMAEMGEV